VTRFSGEYKTLRLAQPKKRCQSIERKGFAAIRDDRRLWYHPAVLRILVDYRPALRHRTGVGEYAHNLSAALARRRDVEVALFSSSWKDRLEPDAVAGAATIDVRIPVGLLNFAWHRLAWPPIENLGAEADVVWSLHPLLIPTLTAAQAVTVHDLYFLDHPEATVREIRRDYPRLAATHARRAAAVIVNSEYTKGLVESRLGVAADRVAVCYPGAPAWRVREEPLGPGPILHIGTIEPRKNVEAVIEAYRTLKTAVPDPPSLVFAGRADVAVQKTGDPSVRYLGYVSEEERLELYRHASMLVIASRDEGFGLPVLEAMTIGLPVIAANRGALPEVLGGAGLLVDADSPREIAQAMQRLLADPVLRREQAAKGVARATAFSWDASALRLLDAFRGAVARGHAGA
jgi:glycosyltransferase involved in cell wall biosynthesis